MYVNGIALYVLFCSFSVPSTPNVNFIQEITIALIYSFPLLYSCPSFIIFFPSDVPLSHFHSILLLLLFCYSQWQCYEISGAHMRSFLWGMYSGGEVLDHTRWTFWNALSEVVIPICITTSSYKQSSFSTYQAFSICC